MGRFLKVAAVYLIHIFIYKKGLGPFFMYISVVVQPALATTDSKPRF